MFDNSNCALFLFIAYQLRVCQPPANVPNAEILVEDDEFEIGNIKIKLNKSTKFIYEINLLCIGCFSEWKSYL